MLGPISEERVFRLTVIVAAAGISIVALTALTNATAGALWGLALVLLAAWVVFRTWRRSRSGPRRRVLIVTTAPLEVAALRADMGEAWRLEPTEVMVLVPSQHAGCASKVERERQGMELSLQAVQEAGARAQGRVMELGVAQAVAAARERFEPDEVIFATPELEAAAN
jgi:hypothetical protein